MILLSLIWGCVIFSILLLLSFGVYCLLRRPQRSDSRNVKTGLIISLSNCFACGVFLATCFLGLLPHIRLQELHIRNLLVEAGSHSDHSSYIFLNSELVVLIGFLLILLVEEAAHTFQKSSSHGLMEHSARVPQIPPNGKTSKNVLSITGGEVSSSHSNRLPALLALDEDTEPLVSDSNSIDGSNDEANSMPKIEFRRISDEAFQGHSHSGHSHFAFLSSKLSLSTFALLLGLSAHSLFEGIALGIQRTSAEFYSLMVAIMLHEVLCSFAFGVSLAHQNTPVKTAFVSSIILASSIPLGMSSSLVVSSLESFNAQLCRFVLEGLAAGTFVYVACIEMLSHELNVHEQSTKPGLSKVFAVIIGVFVFFFITTAFGHHAHAHFSSHSAATNEVTEIFTTPGAETNH